MTTPATAAFRRLASAALTGLVLVPAGALLAAPAYADGAVSSVSATPTVAIGEPAYVAAPTPTPSASDWPDSGGWIIGGTLQEGTTAGPKAAPAKHAVQPVRPATAAAPAARPVTVTAPAARPVTVTAPASVPAGAVPAALPFTGPERLALQLTLGVGLVVLGGVLTSSAGRNRTFAPLR